MVQSTKEYVLGLDSFFEFPRRYIQAHLEHFKAVNEVFPAFSNAYIKEHEASGENWLRNIPRNTLIACEATLKKIAEIPQRTLDKYFEDFKDKKDTKVTSSSKT